MSREIAEGKQQVKEAMHRVYDELEQRVEARTAELAQANADLKAESAERQRLEELLRKIKGAYKALGVCNQALINNLDEIELLRQVCRIIKDDCGYHLVWIGVAEQDEAKTVRPVAQAGYEAGYLDTVIITWADTEAGRGPTGTAIRTRRPVVNRNVLDNPNHASCRAQAIVCGYASSAAFPLLNNKGKAIAALNVYAAQPDAFASEETELLIELAGDLADSITSLRMQAQFNWAEEALEREKKLADDIINSLPGIFYLYDEQMILVRWNKKHEVALGYSAQELGQMHTIDFFEGDDKALIQSKLDKLFAEGVVDVEACILTKNGGKIPYYFTALRTKLGGRTYFMGLGVDITERVRAEKELRCYAGRLNILSEIDQGILAAKSPESVARVVVNHIRQFIPCRRVGVTLFDFEANEAVLLAVDDSDGTELTQGIRISLEPFEHEIKAGRQGRITVITGLRLRGLVTEALYAEGIRSLVGVPLISQGELIGSFTLGLGTSDPGAFTREWENFARLVAERLAIAIQQARLHEQVQRHAEELERSVADRTQKLTVLYQVTAVASESLDQQTMLARALERVLEAMKSDAGLIHLLNDDRERLHLTAYQGLPPDFVAQMKSLPAKAGLGGWVIEHDQPLLISDISSDPRLPVQGDTVSRMYIGMPMRAGGRAVGMLSVLRETKHPRFSAEEIVLLTSIADQLGTAAENARLRQLAEQSAVMEERERLARELHDSVAQSLYSMVLLAEGGRRLAGAGDMKSVQDYFSDFEEITLQALKEMRLLLFQLRPPVLEREGLVGALQQRLDAVEGRAGTKVRFLVDGEIELTAAEEEAFYGIAQEALNNALKHASATSLTVSIRSGKDRGVELEIEDNGLGFDPLACGDQGGMGLHTMRQRAEQLGGKLQVISAIGEVTKFLVIIA